MPENQPDEFVIDLREIFNGIGYWFWLVLASIILCASIALIYSWLQPAVYQASTRIFLVPETQNEQSVDISQPLNLNQLLQTNARILSMPDFLNIVSQKINYRVTDRNIDVNVLQNTQIIELNVQDTDPKRAALIVDTMVASLIEQNNKLQSSYNESLEADINSQIKKMGNQITNLQNKLVNEKQRILDEQLRNTQKKISEAKKEFLQLDAERNLLVFNPSPEAIIRLRDINDRIEELQLMISSYETLYTELITTMEFQREDPVIYGLQQRVDLYSQMYLELLNDLQNVRLTSQKNTASIIQFSPASIPVRPTHHNIGLNTGLGALTGLILSIIFIIFRDFMNKSIKSSHELEKLFGAEVIGQIPKLPASSRTTGIYVISQIHSAAAEYLRLLSASLEFSRVNKPLKTILITSSETNEGKTLIACNLAAVMAQNGKKILLVDADFHRPQVHRYANLDNTLGLSNLFLEDKKASSAIQTLDRLPNLKVLTSGTPPLNPFELFSSRKMKQILNDLSNDFDHIIIDAPSMLISDPQILGPQVDAVLIVAVIGKTNMEKARQAKQQLQRTGANLFGIVVNQVISNELDAYYPKGEDIVKEQETKPIKAGWMRKLLPFRNKGIHQKS